MLESDTTANRHVVTAKMVYVETQLDRQTVLAGRLTYTLRQEAGALRIVLRRLDILNCDAAWPSIQCFP